MSVKLSLVGFGVNSVELDIGNTDTATVKTLLDVFQQASQYPFSYVQMQSPYRPNVNLLFAMTYKGNLLDSQLAQSAGQVERVWQFYVADENGIPVPNNSGQGRTPFDQFEVKDGYSVIWRLITVIKQPIETAKRVRNGTTPEQADARHQTYKLY